MGYRSEVAYVIKFNTISDRESFVTLMLAKNEPVTAQAIDECECRYGNHPIITFSAGDVKWYESYPDVKIHHALMKQAAELYDAAWRFVRIGEEQGDIEVEEHGEKDLWEYIEPRSYISIDLPLIDEKEKANADVQV